MKNARWIFAVLVMSCSSHSNDLPYYSMSFSGPVNVRAATAKSKIISRQLPGNGRVTEQHVVEIHATYSGIIQEVRVKEGTRVKPGDTLAVFSAHPLLWQKRAALASVRRLRYEYESQKLGFPSSESDTIAEALLYLSGLREAELHYEIIKSREREAVLISYHDGQMVDWNIMEGDYYSRGEVLGRILTTHPPVVMAYFLENELELFEKGMTSKVTLPGGNVVHGKLLRISPRVDDKGRIMTYWSLDSVGHVLPGASATVHPLFNDQPGIVVPLTAVTGDEKNAVVFTIREDSARWNSVVTRWYSKDSVHILAGLKIGDRIILSNQLAIHDGTPVSEIREPIF